MNTQKAAKQILVLASLAIAWLLIPPAANAAATDSLEVSNILSAAKLEAIRLREDANQMQNFVANQVTWDTHAVYATRVAQDIIAMQEKVDQLDKARSLGSEWQQSAIDRIRPLLKELTATIIAVSDTMLTHPFDKTEYNEYLEANYDYATQLAALISDTVDYGKTKARMEKAAAKLKAGPDSK